MAGDVEGGLFFCRLLFWCGCGGGSGAVGVWDAGCVGHGVGCGGPVVALESKITRNSPKAKGNRDFACSNRCSKTL